MRYPVYPEYKDSGVEWLGEIPVGWKINRLHDLLTIKTSNVDKKTVEGQEPVKLCNYVDVYYNNIIIKDSNYMVASASKDDIQKFSLKKDDVIITKDSESPFDIGIPAYVPDDVDGLVCGYHLSILRSNRSSISGAFLFYSLMAKNSTYQFTLAANGVTRFGLTGNGTKNIIIPVPSLPEQKSIAQFLDKKTSQIDALIEKKKELIEKLKEQRMALITKAVTKGLDDTAPMKDSGVEWLGEIPEGWEVRRIKEFSKTISKGTTPSTEGREILRTGSIRFIKAENINLNKILDEPEAYIDDETNRVLNRSTLMENDLLFVIAGATIGKTAIIKKQHLPANTNQAVAFIRTNNNIMPEYLMYWLQSYLFKELMWLFAVQSAQPNLSMGVLGNFMLPMPPLPEQKSIAEYLDEKTAKIDALIEKVERVIVKLKEYRITLITDAVTGKIKVG